MERVGGRILSQLTTSQIMPDEKVKSLTEIFGLN